ncbi:hypothetical protein B0H10DRAFT_879115 [Mycena sp. CBHHK59/15]|nr:hypothetical protein B0H10DRAFT_879115 [Mycena sp. CBHHK59/15]
MSTAACVGCCWVVDILLTFRVAQSSSCPHLRISFRSKQDAADAVTKVGTSLKLFNVPQKRKCGRLRKFIGFDADARQRQFIRDQTQKRLKRRVKLGPTS